MRRVLILLFLVAGCRTWNVNAFGMPLDRNERYVTASSDLTTEETIGVIVVLTAAIGASVAIALAAD